MRHEQNLIRKNYMYEIIVMKEVLSIKYIKIRAIIQLKKMIYYQDSVVE